MASIRRLGPEVRDATPMERRNRIIRRFNRAILNPLMLRMAHRFHGTYPAVVHHVGRHTGRSYRTPVVAQPVDGGFVIPLPYGTDTDWCRNVRAAGQFSIERAGQTFQVGNPDVVAPGEVLPLIPERARRAWQRFHIQHFLRVQARKQDAARVPSMKSQWEQPSSGLTEVILDVRTNE